MIRKLKWTHAQFAIFFVGIAVSMLSCQKQRVNNLLTGDGTKVWDLVRVDTDSGKAEVPHSERTLFTFSENSVSFLDLVKGQVSCPYEIEIRDKKKMLILDLSSISPSIGKAVREIIKLTEFEMSWDNSYGTSDFISPPRN
jgi:hypothetical protein